MTLNTYQWCVVGGLNGEMQHIKVLMKFLDSKMTANPAHSLLVRNSLSPKFCDLDANAICFSILPGMTFGSTVPTP